MTFKQMLKSKTLGFNGIVATVFTITEALGYHIPTEVTTGVFAVGNFILRLITKKPISEK